MHKQDKQYFYQEGVNIINYLRQYYPSLHLNRLLILKGNKKAKGSFKASERNIYMWEHYYDLLFDKGFSFKEVARQFIMTLCHELGHASDEFLKHPTFKEKNMYPPNYTVGHAQIEAFAVFRGSAMLQRLIGYPGTLFGFVWTKEELEQMGRDSVSSGRKIAYQVEYRLRKIRKKAMYPFKQFFLRLKRSYTAHSKDYLQDFNDALKLYDSARSIKHLDAMRQTVNP